MASTDHRVTLDVHGQVQGVGFRWWVRDRLADLDLTGSATNLADGSVLVVARGPRRTLERLVREIREGDAPGRVRHVTVTWPDDPQATADGHAVGHDAPDGGDPPRGGPSRLDR